MLYYLSLGSNLGEREQTLREAVQRIGQQTQSVPRCSSLYYSAPWGFESDHAFCNLCCVIETDMLPMNLLRTTQAIEQQLGRTCKSVNGQYCDRTIDIDLIRAFDREGKEISCRIMDERQVPVLTLPHPLWQERDFVRIPMAELLKQD